LIVFFFFSSPLFPLLQLDIIVGAMKLEDQFEWDLENETVTPEEFSEVYALDLGLGGEFKYVAILIPH
jgi:hypothetical protein